MRVLIPVYLRLRSRSSELFDVALLFATESVLQATTVGCFFAPSFSSIGHGGIRRGANAKQTAFEYDSSRATTDDLIESYAEAIVRKGPSLYLLLHHFKPCRSKHAMQALTYTMICKQVRIRSLITLQYQPNLFRVGDAACST